MFHKGISRNLPTRKKFLKFKFPSKSDIFVNYNNKKSVIRENIEKCKKDLSACLNDYKRKIDFSNSLYEECKKNHESFEKINAKIRKIQQPKEKKLIFDLINDYYLKRHLSISKDDIKENIFESSELLEANLKRLTMDYILNYKRVDEEIKENERKTQTYNFYQKIPNTKRNKNKINLRKNNSDNNLPGVKIAKMMENLNDVKFMKKIDIIAKSKMMEDKKYNKYINKEEIQTKLEEIKNQAKFENNFNYKNFIKKSLKDIQFLQKNLQNEEENKSQTKLITKTSQIRKSLFSFPTIVKTFPELLYDKINKSKNNISKNLATNDSSSPSVIRFNEKSNSQKSICKYESKENKNDNDRTNSKTSNYFLPQLKNILQQKKFKLRRINKNLFKKTISSPEFKTFNKSKNEYIDETTQIYNQLLNMTTVEKNSIQNGEFMKSFLKEKNNETLNSFNNENSSRNYYNTLKKIHFQFDKDNSREKLYETNNLLYGRKTSNLFNKIKKFQKDLKEKEKLFIKSLLIVK